MAASHVDITTEISLILSTFIPADLAKSGLDPTAVIAVPVLVWRNAQIRKARSAKNRIEPKGIEILPISILIKSANA